MLLFESGKLTIIKLENLVAWWLGNLKTRQLANNQTFNKKVKFIKQTNINMYHSKI